RRLQRCDLPLVDAVIRNSIEPDFSVRPRLNACPLDAVVEIFCLAWGEMIDEARRASGAARVDTNANVVVRYPLFRIDHFPALIEIARPGGHVGMLFRHTLPGARISILKCETFRIRSVAEDDGILAVF